MDPTAALFHKPGVPAGDWTSADADGPHGARSQHHKLVQDECHGVGSEGLERMTRLLE